MSVYTNSLICHWYVLQTYRVKRWCWNRARNWITGPLGLNYWPKAGTLGKWEKRPRQSTLLYQEITFLGQNFCFFWPKQHCNNLFKNQFLGSSPSKDSKHYVYSYMSSCCLTILPTCWYYKPSRARVAQMTLVGVRPVFLQILARVPFDTPPTQPPLPSPQSQPQLAPTIQPPQPPTPQPALPGLFVMLIKKSLIKTQNTNV